MWVTIFTKQDLEQLKNDLAFYEENYDELHNVFWKDYWLNVHCIDSILLSLQYALFREPTDCFNHKKNKNG